MRWRRFFPSIRIRSRPIAYHTWWPSSADPYYQYNVPENNARINYYGAVFTPHVYIDGLIDGGSGGDWESVVLDRAAVESPLRIELSGDPGASTITAVITNTSAGLVSGQLRFVLMENGLFHSGNPHDRVMRDFFAPSSTTGESILLAPGEEITRVETFSVDPIFVEDELQCVVYVQNDGTKEIHQAATIYFQLDEPELAASTISTDDSAGGDGNGRLDPGETADVAVDLFNLNPVDASAVTGVLSSTDPALTIGDAAGSWPDIPGGTSADNAADPFGVSVDGETPWGYEIPVTLTVNANDGYVKEIDLDLPVGSPTHPMGPDAGQYYTYEDLDPYDPSPVFDWIEIDPTLGGPGTLFTLGDDQTRTTTIPFAFQLYGVSSTTLSISSNGFLAVGATSNRDNSPGEIPGPEGPPSMIAGYWMDLNPVATGGGKVYTYDDAANDRYIVEFSGVEHYDGAGLGPAETFQFILYDPSVYPTPTGDGQIVIQYLVVSDPSRCAVGIEDQTETIGTQYLSVGHLNAAAHGLAAGRAIKFTTIPPDGFVSVDPILPPPSAAMLAARPNPFRSGATIRYSLPVAGHATVRVYTLGGALVRTLLDGEVGAGWGQLSWDGTDRRGVALPAGIYLYEIEGAGYEASGRLVRLR